jgi:hypothetical protein
VRGNRIVVEWAKNGGRKPGRFLEQNAYVKLTRKKSETSLYSIFNGFNEQIIIPL